MILKFSCLIKGSHTKDRITQYQSVHKHDIWNFKCWNWLRYYYHKLKLVTFLIRSCVIRAHGHFRSYVIRSNAPGRNKHIHTNSSGSESEVSAGPSTCEIILDLFCFLVCLFFWVVMVVGSKLSLLFEASFPSCRERKSNVEKIKSLRHKLKFTSVIETHYVNDSHLKIVFLSDSLYITWWSKATDLWEEIYQITFLGKFFKEILTSLDLSF